MKWLIITIPGKDKRERQTWTNRKVSPWKWGESNNGCDEEQQTKLCKVMKSSKPSSAGL
jgi:hypothetical protein